MSRRHEGVEPAPLVPTRVRALYPCGCIATHYRDSGIQGRTVTAFEHLGCTVLDLTNPTGVHLLAHQDQLLRSHP